MKYKITVQETELIEGDYIKTDIYEQYVKELDLKALIAVVNRLEWGFVTNPLEKVGTDF